MKKQGKKTVGVYDRPEKRNTKPFIIAVVFAVAILIAIFFARTVFGDSSLSLALPEPGANLSIPALDAGEIREKSAFHS